MISYCPQCGKPIADDVAFCPNCGASMKATPQAQPQAQPQADQASQQVAQMPKDYLIWSILSILFCFWPLGVYAIILSNDVKSLWNNGRYQEAKDKSDSAKKMNIICLIIGCAKWLFVIIFLIIYFVIIFGAVLSNM